MPGGIPDLSIRTDRSESARHYNRMREAVLALFNNPGGPGQLPNVARRFSGLEPVPINDGGTIGFGYYPGSVNFVKLSHNITAGAGFEAEDFVPTLAGTTLDSTPRPRVALSTGTWEAWMVHREIENGSNPQHEARIETTALGTGPGALELDESATRFCVFDVWANGDYIRCEVLLQIESPTVRVGIAEHPFRMVRTGDEGFASRPGAMVWPEGLSTPIVQQFLPVAAGAFAITEAGTVWLDCDVTVGKQSESVAMLSHSGNDVEYQGYKAYSVNAPALVFRPTADKPTAGTKAVDEMNVATCTVHTPLADFTHTSGKAYLSRQIVSDVVWMPEIVDGEIFAI